jgi:hypothetical protein
LSTEKDETALGTNSPLNVTNASSNIFYRTYNKDFRKEEETMPETDYKNTIIDIEDKEKLKKIINNCDTATLNLRTEYLIKLSKLLEMCKRFEQCNDYFRVEKRDIYALNLNNFSKSFDKCNNYLLNEIKTGNILDHQIWANILINYFNFTYNLIKFQKYVINEMHFMRNENLNLKQKLFSLEGEVKVKNKDINDINKYIMQYDLTNKVKYGKKKELSIKEIQQKYNSQESAYILTIFKLEEEIKQLTKVLKKNKYDINNFLNVQETLKNLEAKYENTKEALEKQNDEKGVTIKILTQTIIDLNEKITELEAEIQELKNNEENTKHNYISYEAKIKNLNDIIEKKNSSIEELEKENKVFKEKKMIEGKMFEPADTVFIPMKEKIRRRRNNNNK